MFEQEVRSKEEILEIMYNTIREKHLTTSYVEKSCDFGGGSISRWKVSDPSISKILSVLDFLDIKIILRTDSVDEYIESSDETKEMKTTEIQTEIIEELIALNLLRLFKKNISSESKQRLLEFLVELSKE